MKQINKLTIPLLILAFILSACNSTGTKTKNSNSDSKKQNTDGWELLFNGITTAGWHTYGKDSAGKAWKAEDSALHLDASVKSEWQTKGGGDIVTDNEYENFELELEWKISEGGNSGIMFYVKEDT